MLSYTLGQQFLFVYVSHIDKEYSNHIKYIFAAGILLFVFQLLQWFYFVERCVQISISCTGYRPHLKNSLLTEETFQEIWLRLDNYPHKSLSRLTYQTNVSKTTTWRATKNLHLPQYKITHVQGNGEEDCDEICIFVTVFFSGSTRRLYFLKVHTFTDEDSFHLRRYAKQ